MSGTKHTLQRDLANPMKLQPLKTCLRCHVAKANDFKHYGKKLWRSRTEYTTTDICLDCKARALRTTLKQKSDEAAEYAKWSREQQRARAEAFMNGKVTESEYAAIHKGHQSAPLGSVPEDDEKL